MLYDPYQMAALAQGLERDGLPMKEYPQTLGNLSEMASNLFELVRSRALVTYPSAELRRAVAQAVALETARGWKIAKEKQAHRIDILIALAMAALVAVKRDEQRGEFAIGIINGYGGAGAVTVLGSSRGRMSAFSPEGGRNDCIPTVKI